MAYADYVFYIETYEGNAIAQADFPRLARQASAAIDALTFERAVEIVEAETDAALIARIKLATCAIAEEMQRQEQGGAVASERVGDHSVTYATTPTAQLSEDARLARAAKLYLGASGLMYRGLNADE